MPKKNSFTNGLQRYLKPEQIARIQRIRIGVGGAGGLGSNAVMCLARSGFQHFEIIDKDQVDDSNLNRQDFLPSDIGHPKAVVLDQKIRQLNPAADIRAHACEWGKSAANKYFQECDYVLEAFDQALTKRDFVEYYAAQGKTVITGIGMAGISGGNATTVRRVGNIYAVGDGNSDIQQGLPVLAPRVIQCAARMADVVLQLTLTDSVI